MSGARQQQYERSLKDPEGFWSDAARELHWDRPFARAVAGPDPQRVRWFEGGQLNTCFNALDRHVRDGRGDQAALIYDSPMTDSVRRFSYAELTAATASLAGALSARGVGRGDRVLIYMPMIPEAVMAMLACARLGAVHSVVFGGFAAHELATRIDDCLPRLILSASCGLEPGRVVAYKPLLDQAIAECSHPPQHCLVLQRPQLQATLQAPRDLDWEQSVTAAEPAPCVPVDATDPLYILYTSGTTGACKGVVRDNGGHAVAMRWSLQHVYGMQPGEVFWAASDIGWVVGHSYIVYAPLLLGCTTILYEGKPVGTPDAGAFWRVIRDHGVHVLFTAPTALRAVKKEDPTGALLADYDRKNFRTLFLAGERADPDTVQWCEDKLQVPVIDHWWQTETGWPIVANCLGIESLPIKRGSPTLPVPGFQVHVLGEGGKPVPNGESGALCLKLPLPPGCLPTLWNAEERFVQAYLTGYPGYYECADGGYIDEDGYVWVMGRTDDVINVAGHRLSTGAMEEILAQHPHVAECAVVGVADELKGSVPLGLLVLNAGVSEEPASIVAQVVALVRQQLGPVAAFKQAVVVPRLPKTRSGKVLRRTMRAMADGEAFELPATIDDPVILDDIRVALAQLGYPHGS